MINSFTYSFVHRFGTARVTALHAAVSGSIPGKIGIFNKNYFSLGLAVEPQSLVSVPNTFFFFFVIHCSAYLNKGLSRSISFSVVLEIQSGYGEKDKIKKFLNIYKTNLKVILLYLFLILVLDQGLSRSIFFSVVLKILFRQVNYPSRF